MDTVFPCRSPQDLERADQSPSDGTYVPAPPSLLVVQYQQPLGGPDLQSEAADDLAVFHVFNDTQYLNNNPATTAVVQTDFENAALAALVGGVQYVDNESSAAHVEAQVENVVFTTAQATFHSDAAFCSDVQISEAKPLPKRRRVLDRSQLEADGLQFINSYCIALAMDTDEKSVEFCQKLGLLRQKSYCPLCGDTLSNVYTVKRKNKRSTSRFQCNKRKCKQTGKNVVSVKDKSWFQSSSLSYRKNLIIVKCFVDSVETSSAIRESSVPEENNKGEVCTAITSCESVIDMYAACREVCALSLFNLSAETEVGGQGNTIEVGQSCFERLKHVSAVQNHWLLAGICRETDRAFVEVVPTGDPAAVLAVVLKHVKTGSHIITECSSLIQCSSELLHHGYSFSTSDLEGMQKPGAKKNSQTNHWQGVRKHFPFARITGGMFALHLAELLWKREHRQDRDPLRSFIADINKVCEF